CALEKITGAPIGTEQQAWKDWYTANGGSTSSVPQQNDTSTAITAAPTPAFPVKSAEDVILKATYRITLTTGDELTGVIESKDDTSLILETTDGKPYVFRYSLIRQYELLKRPQVTIKPNADRMQLSWDELQTVSEDNLYLEVTIAGGTAFRGTLASIDQSMLRINVEGSKIPITKEAIRKIMVLPGKDKPEDLSVKKSSLQGPFDTILVKNPQVDDWGVRGADIKLIGLVQSQNDQSIIMKLLDESTRIINRADVIRVFLNSSTANKAEDPIKLYAKPLFCPGDMFLVDMPPGKKGKPFFKVCVDRYEFPNRKDQVPVASVSFLDAKKHCESQGKRLCTAEEWEWACGGLEGYQYPYGFNREENKCNSDTRQIEPSGARLNCVSKFGGYDMTGNIFEWVVGKNNEPAMMGGPYSKCQTVSPGLDGSAKPQTGLRCCKR
ncbi:MAG TPA: SUMF1/EgtB/PvdO family nonheme iron enzyme, partial [Chitinispirillaceae bacterium]|nr:SUMF1/EgtB/PvdO family nonheme iron enzyme [Chitinispirillaceae bacterium]